VPPDENFVPLMVVQGCGVLVLLGLILVWPGPWNPERWAGLALTIPVATLFFLARFQLGRSFSVTPQARELVTRGVYSKIRHPMYLSSGLMFLCLAIALQLRYLLRAIRDIDPGASHSSAPGKQGPRRNIRRRLPRIQEKDLVLDRPLRLAAWYFVMALNLAHLE
jgi:Phospholipid methyltransferase